MGSGFLSAWIWNSNWIVEILYWSFMHFELTIACTELICLICCCSDLLRGPCRCCQQTTTTETATKWSLVRLSSFLCCRMHIVIFFRLKSSYWYGKPSHLRVNDLFLLQVWWRTWASGILASCGKHCKAAGPVLALDWTWSIYILKNVSVDL